MCGRFASSSCGRHHGAGRHRRLTNDAATSAVAASAAVIGRRPRLHGRRRRSPWNKYRSPNAAHVRRLSNMTARAVFRRTHYTTCSEQNRVGLVIFTRVQNSQSKILHTRSLPPLYGSLLAGYFQNNYKPLLITIICACSGLDRS